MVSRDCSADFTLDRYAAGDLPEAEAEAICAHVAACPDCLERLDQATRRPNSLVAALRWGSASRCSDGGLDGLRPTLESRELKPGETLNGYRIVKELGRGGMGRVFLAEHPRLGQQVALKVMGVSSRQGLVRFEAERQSLALMDHPNIARVLDSGVTEEGRPFFAMELVQGAIVTRWCDDRRLSVRERCSLFIPVCQAVQHAHQKGIIHRDLKPSNVLVTEHDGRPVPKVIDFGVAKAIGRESAAQTEYGMVVGTPEYMSPEQASLSAGGVDARSDVYALGVLLFELLTGDTPFGQQARRRGPALELLRAIQMDDAPSPSSRLAAADTKADIAAQRDTEPGRLVRQVRGELDWIVLKALEKDPARRYDSAAALADDVRRCLQNEPVLAGPPSVSYRLRKFSRRHRVAVGAAALVFLALLAGFAGTSFGLLRATRALKAEQAARARTMAALRSLTDRVVERRLGQQVKLDDADRRFLQQVIVEYQSFADVHGDDAESRAIMAEGLLRVGMLRRALGEPLEALNNLDRSRDLLLTLAAEFPKAIDQRLLLAATFHERTMALRDLGRGQEAEADHLSAIAANEEVLKEHPKLESAMRQLAGCHGSWGTHCSQMSRNDEALAAYQQELRLLDELAAQSPGDLRDTDARAQNHTNRGVVYRRTGKLLEAESEFEQSLALFTALRDAQPDLPEFRLHLATTQDNLGHLLAAQRKFDAAAAAHRAALTIRRLLAADFPGVPRYRDALAMSHGNLGLALQRLNQRAEAEAEYQHALTLGRRLAADFPNSSEYTIGVAATCCNLGNLARDNSRIEQALPWYGEAILMLTSILDREPQNFQAKNFLCNSHYARARALMEQKRHADSIPDWDRAIELDPSEVVTPLRRALCLAHINPQAAVAEVDRLAPSSQADGLLELARILSVAAANETDSRRREACATRAVAWLRRLQEQGFFKKAQMQKLLKSHGDLAGLREREDFRKLLADLDVAPQ